MATITDMSLSNTSLLVVLSTFVKIGVGLLILKILALTYGPKGIGQTGHYRQLITLLCILSGAGIFNGITKLVAEYQFQPQKLRVILGTGSSIIICSSILLGIVLIIISDTISYFLFGHKKYCSAIIILAIFQISIAYTNLGLAILKGYSDAIGNTFACIISNMLGFIIFFICYQFSDYFGVLVGLALMPAIALLPTLYVLCYRHQSLLVFLIPTWDIKYAILLSKFTAMALITAIALPIAYLIMRNLIAHHMGWEAVGIWQGIINISDAYLQFITTIFGIYLLPILSRMNNKQAIAKEIKRVLKFIFPVMIVFSLIIWLFRDMMIKILFSPEFKSMSSLFGYQILGDTFKASAYIFGYLVVARAALCIYLLVEIIQFILLTGFSYWLIPHYGILGAAQAYMATYITYFILCSSVFFLLYLKRFYLKKK